MEFWRQAGIPLDKLILGVAAYGRSLVMNSPNLHHPGDPYTGKLPDAAPYTKEQGFYAYYEV